MSKRHFTPDVRSSVGRQIITDSFIRHRQRIFEAKPSVDTNIPKSVIIQAKQAPRRFPTVTEKQQYDQVTGLFKRLSQAKPTLVTHHTIPAVVKQTGRRKRQEEREMREHACNIAHMQRRMLDAYTVTERKKNIYDPTCYPSLLMRRSVDVLSLPLTPPDMSRVNTSKVTDRSVRSSQQQPATARSIMSGTHTNTLNTSKQRSTHHPADHVSFSERSPRSTGMYASSMEARHVDALNSPSRPRAATAADYVMFKQHLIDTIVSHRLYKPAELNQFFATADAVHAHLDKRMKQQVISEIRQELQVFPDEENTNALASAQQQQQQQQQAPSQSVSPPAVVIDDTTISPSPGPESGLDVARPVSKATELSVSYADDFDD